MVLLSGMVSASNPRPLAIHLSKTPVNLMIVKMQNIVSHVAQVLPKSSTSQFVGAELALTRWRLRDSYREPPRTNSISKSITAGPAGGLSCRGEAKECGSKFHHGSARGDDFIWPVVRPSGSRNTVWVFATTMLMRTGNSCGWGSRGGLLSWTLAIYSASGNSCGCETKRLICIMDFLDYPGLRVVKISRETGVYVVDAEVDTMPAGCLKCGLLPSFLTKHGPKTRELADTPVRGIQVVVRVERQRYICPTCGATTLQPLPGVVGNKRLTARLAEYIAKRATTQTFSAVASETGRSEKNVRTIFKAHATRLISSRNPETPRCLGIDDVYVDRKARCVLVDNYLQRLYELLPQVNKPPLFRFLVQIPGRKDIEVVTMDMWVPFRDAARDALPDASIVVDRFHIQRPLNNAPKKVARDLHPQGKSGKRFSRDPYLLISSSARLNDDEIAKRDIWFNSEPLVRQAYGIKESILNIWNILDRCEAAATYDRLVSEIPPSLQGAFKEFTTSMTNWRVEIFNYWDYPWTNAYAESTNSIIKGIQRAGKSLDFTTVREKALCRDLLRADASKQHRRENRAPAARAGRIGRSSANHPHDAQNDQSPGFNTNFLDPEGRSQEDSDQ